VLTTSILVTVKCRVFKADKKNIGVKNPDRLMKRLLNYVEDETARHTYHAEFLALLQVKNDPRLRNAILIVVRSGGRLSKPCIHCENYILSCGIKRVYYSSKDE